MDTGFDEAFAIIAIAIFNIFLGVIIAIIFKLDMDLTIGLIFPIELVIVFIFWIYSQVEKIIKKIKTKRLNKFYLEGLTYEGNIPKNKNK